MSNTDDLITIRTRFFSLWPNATPVVLDNDPAVVEPTMPWARFSIQPGASVRASIASRTYLQLGRVYLQIFVPAHLGTTPGWTMAETFKTIFRDWRTTDNHLRFNTPEFAVVTNEPEYFGIRCSAPYESWQS